jgi:hypothetical protein
VAVQKAVRRSRLQFERPEREAQPACQLTRGWPSKPDKTWSRDTEVMQ